MPQTRHSINEQREQKILRSTPQATPRHGEATRNEENHHSDLPIQVLIMKPLIYYRAKLITRKLARVERTLRDFICSAKRSSGMVLFHLHKRALIKIHDESLPSDPHVVEPFDKLRNCILLLFCYTLRLIFEHL